MADTDTETLPNGTATLTEEEEERLKQRPADIDADVREMERRKRVEALMSSKLFREELERVLDQQSHEGGDAPLLQRIREMVGGRLHSGSLRGPTCVLPINDIRGIEGVGYEKGEKILRCKLAAVYRLVDLFGWTQTGINGQITARLNTAVESVLTTPRGILPHEVTASSLVKVDMQGAVQDQGTTNFPVNVEGFSLHAAVHSARPDIRCVLHVRSVAALSVSSMQRGLLPLCHEAAALGDCAIHRVPLGILDNEEKDKLVRALGPHSKVLILSNAGALCCGATLEEAFHHARLLTAAADVQLRLASIPLEHLALIDEETRKQMYEATHKPPADAVKWRVGGEEFEALMRMLDNAGFRTGYIYRHPLIKNDVPRPKNDVEVPPAVSSLGYLLEEEELYKQGLWKKGHGKTGERTRWLNSPNVYQKVEVLETGTTDPKKITKWVDANNDEWVQDGSPAHSSTPVKIDTLQFVPKNTNPKEFKKLQQQIKENRRADKISAGPQSHILEGVTWDEASKLVGEDAANTHTGDHVVLMGAASKGIIQRGYQHNATMYSAPYARNPFDHVTDTEIEDYRRAVERKGKNDYDTDLSESEAISGAQITSPASAPSETEEESRDEHRVLRIETMQAPVRSQPEVVLSDVDTTDFLNSERAHADRTKDPNLLSDDEVFLDSAASTVTSSMTSGMTSGVTSPQPPAHVVIRTQHTAVAQTVARGTKEANPLSQALSTNKRSIHDYTRSTNFDNIVQIYESPEKNDNKSFHPKCKVSLNSRLNDNAVHIPSSASSLVSIPSIEWDGRTKSDYVFKTRSLPRQRVSVCNRLYRTRSHGGFVNEYIKDPEPRHYHLPSCRSCGATDSSYAWELTKEDSCRSLSQRTHRQTSVFLSIDNIPQKCLDEAESVKIREVVVPKLKVEKVPEFIESQEFTEDIYLGELGISFSSENQTVIEKPNVELDVTVTKDKNDKIHVENDNGEIYRAECVHINPIEDSLETSEGEYHSFTDDFEEAYESPVKDLVEKDIRDYSVPINFYCDDYVRKNETGPRKSPHKVIEAPKIALEPILEESKSSYGDDSGNLSNNSSKRDPDVQALVEKTIDEVLMDALLYVENKAKNVPHLETNIVTSNNEIEIIQEESTSVIETQFKTQKNNKNVSELSETTASISNNNLIKLSRTSDQRKSSIEYSIASSTNELVTLDSTVEFEKYEAVSELLMGLLNKIDYDSHNNVFFQNIKKITTGLKLIAENDEYSKADTNIIPQGSDNDQEAPPSVDVQNNYIPLNDTVSEGIIIAKNKQEYCDLMVTQDFKESISTTLDDCDEHFSITKLVHDIESNIHLNETILSESSDSGITETFKIAESILYYIFDKAFFMSKNKNQKKPRKNVVTVADPEDIMYTALTIWPSMNDNIVDLCNNDDKDVIDDFLNKSNDGLMNKSNSELKCQYIDNNTQNGISVYAHSCSELLHQLPDMNVLYVKKDFVTSTCSEHEEIVSYDDDDDFNDSFSNERENVENLINFYQNNPRQDLNNNFQEELEEHQQDMNNTVDVSTGPYISDQSSDDEECRELSENSVEVAEDIIYSIFYNISYKSDDDSETDVSNVTYIHKVKDKNVKPSDEQYLNTTYNENSEAYDCSNETEYETDPEIDSTSDETLGGYTNNMNIAFVQTSSSPQKECKAFDSCTVSPIRFPDSNFETQDLTVQYENDTLLGSPFVKQAAVISMSQTEGSGGIKYWVSFDDSISTDRANTRCFHDSVTERVWRKAKKTDEAIPSFYRVDFQNNDENCDRNEFHKFRKRSVLVDTVSSTSKSEEFMSNKSFTSNRQYENDIETNADVPDNGTVNDTTDAQCTASPSSSNFYNTCESFEDFESPQKKLLYKVTRRQSLYNTWPPFEETIFYRIISKFRMSESFDPSDLELTRINSV